jgi:hypothetical protein
MSRLQTHRRSRTDRISFREDNEVVGRPLFPEGNEAADWILIPEGKQSGFSCIVLPYHSLTKRDNDLNAELFNFSSRDIGYYRLFPRYNRPYLFRDVALKVQNFSLAQCNTYGVQMQNIKCAPKRQHIITVRIDLI